MRQAIAYCPHEIFSGLSKDAIQQVSCRAQGAPQEDKYFATILKGMLVTMQHQEELAPEKKLQLPSVYEASIFSSETRFPTEFATHFNQTLKELETTIKRLWHGGEDAWERYKRMRLAETRQQGLIVPIGMHASWKYNCWAFLDKAIYDQIESECPYLDSILPQHVRYEQERLWNVSQWHPGDICEKNKRLLIKKKKKRKKE